MSQSKSNSLWEAVANAIIGMLMGIALNYYIMPSFGLAMNVEASALLSLIYTIVGICRSYLIRRTFNHMENKL